MSIASEYREACMRAATPWTEARKAWAAATDRAIKIHGRATATAIAEIRYGRKTASVADPYVTLQHMERLGVLESRKIGNSRCFYPTGSAPDRKPEKSKHVMPEPHHPDDRPSAGKRLRRGFEDDLARARGNLNLARWHAAEAMRLVKSSAAVMRSARATAREQKALLDAEHDLDAIQVQLAVIAGADPGKPAVDLRRLTEQLERALDDESLKAMTVAQAQRTAVRG